MNVRTASVLVCCLSTAEVCFGQVTPLLTRRATAASASGDTVSDGRQESDAGLSTFRSVSVACVTTPLRNTGCGVGTQESGVSEDRFWAVGQGGASTTPGPESDLSTSNGRSGFEIVFRIDAPVRYWLTGSLRANSGSALVTLFGPGGTVVHQYNEFMAESTIDDAGILNPGTYELHMAADASVDPSWEWGSTSADFGATFRWVAYCASDFNGDGFTDFFDYDDFVACYEDADCPTGTGAGADFNNDGFVDFFDYDAFVTAFETGC
jgi:hypothetical protein